MKKKPTYFSKCWVCPCKHKTEKSCTLGCAQALMPWHVGTCVFPCETQENIYFNFPCHFHTIPCVIPLLFSISLAQVGHQPSLGKRQISLWIHNVSCDLMGCFSPCKGLPGLHLECTEHIINPKRVLAEFPLEQAAGISVSFVLSEFDVL